MIKRTSAHSDGPDQRRSSRAFTLVELLVVIGIIVLLAGILLPMASRAYAKAERARVAAELTAIGTALEAYKQDHGSYPNPGVDLPTTNPNTRGANVLCRALIAPGPALLDGAEGPGFTVRPGGKIWSAYLPADQFKVGDINGANITNYAGLDTYEKAFILDRFKKPILYFLAVGNPDLKATTYEPFISNNNSNPRPLFLFNQNSTLWSRPSPGSDGLQSMRIALGDFNNNGRIDGVEQARFKGPYILWSAGPNELYGPIADDAGPTNVLDRADADVYDDITNFRS